MFWDRKSQYGDPEVGSEHWDRLAIHRASKAPAECFIESFNGKLRDELLNDELLDDARRKLAFWRYDGNNVRLHSSHGNKTPTVAHQVLEKFEGSAHDTLAQNETADYGFRTRNLSV